MKIDLTDFGGIMPRVDPMNLPPNGAQLAHNVNLAGGTLRPLASTNANTSLHDDAGDMLPGIDASDIAIIPQAQPVTLDKLIPMCVPWWKTEGAGAASIVYGWALATAYIFVEYIDDDKQPVSDSLHTAMRPDAIHYTPTGFVMRNKPAVSLSYTFESGRAYRIYGPIIQLTLPNYAYRQYVGGPDQDYVFPEVPTSGDEQLPSIAVPLVFPTSMAGYVDNGNGSIADDAYLSPTAADIPVYQYGTLQCTDYAGPQKTGRYDIRDLGSVTEILLSADSAISLTFECNLVRNRPERVYYLQQLVDSVGRDGPESDVSAEVLVPPGHFPALTLPTVAGYTNRLYRSANAGSGFLKIGDETGPYYDQLRQSLLSDLRPNGAFPHASAAIAAQGAIAHPAGYSLFYYGNELRPSSEWADTERPWALPAEYARAFDSTIQCLALSGGTVLVFTETAVYSVNGQHPAHLSVYRVSDKPILGRISLWEMGGLVGWNNEEGIAIYGDGAAQLLTGEHMRAEDWQALEPDGYDAQINDRALLLLKTDADGLRFDMRGPRTAAMSTFDAVDGTAPFEWKSKLFRLPERTSWYAARVVADDYPIVVRMFGDGVDAAEVHALDDRAFILPRTQTAREWEFLVSGRGEVRQVTIATSMSEA